jgi:rod shape determining protein RodA
LPRRCFGITKKGATRWLNLGVAVIQPSEILKIAVPLMLAWWFQKREGQLRVADFVVAAAHAGGAGGAGDRQAA